MDKMTNVNQIKQNNTSLIRRALRSIAKGTKLAIAQITGLSVSTCNTILNELAETGEFLSLDPAEGSSTVGRPAKQYLFNKDHSHILCLYPTTSESSELLNYAIVNLMGDPIVKETLVMERVTEAVIMEEVEKILHSDPLIRTISIGIPGYYSQHRICSCGIANLNGTDLPMALEEAYGVDVYIENNMNAMVYGYSSKKHLVDNRKKNIAMVSFFKNSGPGAGILLDGKIHHGSSNFAGEVLTLPYPGGKIHDLIDLGKDSVIQCASINVVCFSSILDPDAIIFTGENISRSMLADIRAASNAYIPQEHLPELLYTSNYMNYYLYGLAELALDRLL